MVKIMKEYYRKTVDEILKEFNTSLNGLDSKDIKNIQKIYGRNELKESGIIPQNTEVTPYINGSNNMPEINEHAQRFTDERLENNYEMVHDPTAEPGLKPIEEGHHKTR